METKELLLGSVSLVVATLAYFLKSLHGQFAKVQEQVQAHERQMAVLTERADGIITRLDAVVEELKEYNRHHINGEVGELLRLLREKTARA